MTDAMPIANSEAPAAASVPGAHPHHGNTAGQGDAERFATSAVPGFGGATLWPTRPGVARPAGWFRPASGEAAPPGGSQTEPARPGIPDDGDNGESVASPVSPSPGAGTWQATRQPAIEVPGLGLTAALRGRAGGPGFEVPPGVAQESAGTGNQSGWKRAQGVWQESGVRWEQPGAPRSMWDSGSGADQNDAAYPSAPAFASAPALADIPAVADTPAVADAAHADTSEPGYSSDLGCAADDMYRAWHASVREASGIPRSTRARSTRARSRGRLAWQAIRVGVPVGVVITVGVGALLMLTGKSNEMLAPSAGHGAPTAGRDAPAAGNARVAGNGQVAGFTGYPGEHGAVAVDSLAVARSTQVAVGNADGHPAIWHRSPNGAWSLVSANLPAAYQVPGTENLGSVAHGGAGWIAVGYNVSGGPEVPVLVTSSDGVTWRAITGTEAFTGAGIYLNAVAAGKDGYVVVGQQIEGGRRFAAIWWSPDLRHWARAGLNETAGLNGTAGSRTVTDIYGVTAAATGFVAVGWNGGAPAIWTSGAGVSWQEQAFSRPESGPVAKLIYAAANGDNVVAVGNASLQGGGDAPFAIVSSDGGRNWRQVLLPAPAGFGVVTALTATSGGFVLAGATGPGKHPHPVIWTSPDGLTWSAPASANGGQVITALAVSADSAQGHTAQGHTAQGHAVLGASKQPGAPETLPVAAG